MATKQRLRFVQDDSSHWYAISADEHSRELFDVWVSSFDYENEDKEYRGPDFEPVSYTHLDVYKRQALKS